MINQGDRVQVTIDLTPQYLWCADESDPAPIMIPTGSVGWVSKIVEEDDVEVVFEIAPELGSCSVRTEHLIPAVLICSQCGFEARDANEITCIKDHGMCHDCHVKWQHGELDWQEEWHWGMGEGFVPGARMRITHDITLNELYDLSKDVLTDVSEFMCEWLSYMERIYGVKREALPDFVAVKRGSVAVLVKPDTNLGDCTTWIARIHQGERIEEIDLHPEDAVFEEDWNES